MGDDQHHIQGPRGKFVMAGTKTPNSVGIKPRLVSLATKSPADGAWRWEIKIDVFRFLARIDGRVVQLFTKNGHDWTNKVPRLARSLARLAGCALSMLGRRNCVSARGWSASFPRA